MAQSAISLCSKALVKLGAQPISSFLENTAEAEIASQLYQPIRDDLLSAYPWRFATAQTQLNQLVEAPKADFRCAYQLPNDFLRVLSAGVNNVGRGLNYRIYEKTLQCNDSNVILTYIFNPQEQNYPPFFNQLLIAKLAAEFCLPLTENTSRTEFLTRQANDLFAKAKLIDAQQDIPTGITDFSLIGVRL
ncbi:MAG: hypothetical protein J6P93_05425 [Alphaproteobacteria bacterium]|nr:hypothetical protein [Alphaproteobacteria bacterium]